MQTDENKLTTADIFVPNQLLQFLGIQADEAAFSDMLKKQIECNAVVLQVGIDKGEEVLHSTNAAATFSLVNELFELAVPAVRRFNGMIDCFLENGFQALFTKSREDGVRAAIQIRENILQRKYIYEDRVTVGLAYGPVSVGVIGFEDRVSPITMSMHTSIARFLQKKAGEYHAHILLTGTLLESISDYATLYGHRPLGLFYRESEKKEERIYDLFDGDAPAARQTKRKTKQLFEKGMHVFLERDFVKARGFFIEVLKADRSDTAARKYLSLCDGFLLAPPSESIRSLCLERM
ncbi:MAG: hypothetical protein IJ679_12970 [Lachnospiraceae bacterium]|nr:hypothetical protein [Lachnospiraceae bacterium]